MTVSGIHHNAQLFIEIKSTVHIWFTRRLVNKRTFQLHALKAIEGVFLEFLQNKKHFHWSKILHKILTWCYFWYLLHHNVGVHKPCFFRPKIQYHLSSEGIKLLYQKLNHNQIYLVKSKPNITNNQRGKCFYTWIKVKSLSFHIQI